MAGAELRLQFLRNLHHLGVVSQSLGRPLLLLAGVDGQAKSQVARMGSAEPGKTVLRSCQDVFGGFP